MTNSTVVILTEPARCQLADADALVQAVLHAQQLNKAGVGASQAFCDHPAAAVRFIEAYAKAYPELQLRSSDLPPPEHLYSIIADGRVAPLPLPAASDGGRSGDAGQLYPLYVLSLGAPDALIRALEHNRFAQSDIQLVEIARPDKPADGPMSVAEAVAHGSVSRASWRAEASAEPDRYPDEVSPAEELGANDPLKLATVEVDLDHIQVDRGTQRDGVDPATAEAVAVVAPPATGPGADSGGSWTASASGMSGGSSTTSDAAARSGPEAAPAGAASSAPALEPGGASPTPTAAPATAVGDGEISPEPDSVSTAPDDPGGDEPGGTPPAGPDDEATPRGEDEAKSPEDTSGGDDAPKDSDAADDATDVRMSETEAAAADQARLAATSFGAPGGNVHYPPACSFAMDDDVAYPAPAGSGPELGMFEGFFGGAEESDAVDLEAVLAGLSDAAGASAAPVPDLDLRLRRGRDAISEPEEAGPPEPDGSRPDEDSAEHKAPVVHDLDI